MVLLAKDFDNDNHDNHSSSDEKLIKIARNIIQSFNDNEWEVIAKLLILGRLSYIVYESTLKNVNNACISNDAIEELNRTYDYLKLECERHGIDPINVAIKHMYAMISALIDAINLTPAHEFIKMYDKARQRSPTCRIPDINTIKASITADTPINVVESSIMFAGIWAMAYMASALMYLYNGKEPESIRHAVAYALYAVHAIETALLNNNE